MQGPLTILKKNSILVSQPYHKTSETTSNFISVLWWEIQSKVRYVLLSYWFCDLKPYKAQNNFLSLAVFYLNWQYICISLSCDTIFYFNWHYTFLAVNQFYIEIPNRRFLLSCLGPLVLVLSKLQIIWLSNLSILSVPDECYSETRRVH